MTDEQNNILKLLCDKRDEVELNKMERRMIENVSAFL